MHRKIRQVTPSQRWHRSFKFSHFESVCSCFPGRLVRLVLLQLASRLIIEGSGGAFHKQWFLGKCKLGAKVSLQIELIWLSLCTILQSVIYSINNLDVNVANLEIWVFQWFIFYHIICRLFDVVCYWCEFVHRFTFYFFNDVEHVIVYDELYQFEWMIIGLFL